MLSQTLPMGMTQTTLPMQKSGFFSGSPASLLQASRLNPQQQSTLGQLLPGVGQQVGNNNLSFAPIAQRAREQFHTQTIPSLAARFAGLGSGGSLRGSSFQGAIGGAASDLESQLASGEAQYGLQRQQLLQQLLGLLMQPNQENIYQPQSAGFLEGIAGPLANFAGKAALLGGAYYMGGLPALGSAAASTLTAGE